MKCTYSPSLADLCYNAFDCVVIDEGVRMKGEETYVGKGVRSMEPKYRLILTATPVKNRLPDIFRLAWWASGGLPEAHARWPYADDPSERGNFAETFMVSERNLTKERAAGWSETCMVLQPVTTNAAKTAISRSLFMVLALKSNAEHTGREHPPLPFPLQPN